MRTNGKPTDDRMRALHRILILIKGLGRGGAEQLLMNAAPYLDRDRFDYQIGYLLPWKNALVEELRRYEIPVVCLGAGLDWTRRLRSLLTARRIDLVHAHLPYPAIGARAALARTGCPLVYTEHNVWQAYRPTTRLANMVTFFRNDHVFTVSDQVRASIRFPSLYRSFMTGSIETLYHGPDPESVGAWRPDGVRQELGIDVSAPLVGTVANLRPEKGHRFLLAAAAIVRRAIPDVRFVLVGDGPEMNSVRQQIERLHLGEAVAVTGFRNDAQRLISAFDVFALPSLHEGLSIALIEALALGKPVVASRAGGVPEVMKDGEHGLLVDPGDVDGLAHGIMTLLRDSDMRHRMGEAGVRRAVVFDIRTAVRRMEEVYEELLS
jgi:glycosyltransferase involved in cell wall biosynthesis